MTIAPSKTGDPLETTVARLVAEALRACGGSLEGCQAPVTSQPSDLKPLNTIAQKTIAHQDLTPAKPVLSGVVSVSVLETLPKNTAAISIAPKAVVTPAARDWLRQHGVTIERAPQTVGLPTVQAVNSSQALIIDVDLDQRAEGVARQLTLRGLPSQLGSIETLAARRTSLAIVLADLPAVEVDRLARTHGMSAAAVDSLDLVRRIQSKMTPDVWVLDTVRLTISGLVAVAEACLRGTLHRIAGEAK